MVITGVTASRGSHSGGTEHPDLGTLPDLSRLALGDGNGDRDRGSGGLQGPASPTATTGLTLGRDIHINLHANTQGAPVTINILPTFTHEAAPRDGGDRVAHRIHRSRAQGQPALGMGRVRLGGNPGILNPPPVVTATPLSTTATTPTVPAPIAMGAGPVAATEGAPVAAAMSTPPSPSLESAPDSRAPSPTPSLTEASNDDRCKFRLLATHGHYSPGLADEYIAPPDPAHNRWYVVTAGRRVGIWREWTDMSHYVTRVPGNQHKLFNSRALAEAHYYGTKESDGVEVIFA